MNRICRILITLTLVLAMSISAAFAAGETDVPAGAYTAQAAGESEASPQTGVFEKNGNYYYMDPGTGEIRKDAGFIRWNGDRYYIKDGGRIITSKLFKIGKYSYRAHADGRIAVGVYRWGEEGRLYYSEPENGRLVTMTAADIRKGVKWQDSLYYVRADGEVAADRPVVIDDLPYYADAEGKCARIKVNRTKNKVVKIARRQIGRHTIAQVARYWTWFFRSRFVDTDVTPWCGTFVGWCYRKAGRYNKISSAGNNGYVPRYTSYANRKDKWVRTSKAKGGDIIIFGRDRHVGLVEGVYKDYIFTIEGNAGPTAAIGTRLPGAVTRNVYKLTDSDIKGVIHP